jgi:hypothetical protein
MRAAFFGIAEGAAIGFDARLDRGEEFTFPVRQFHAGLVRRELGLAQGTQRRAFGARLILEPGGLL